MNPDTKSRTCFCLLVTAIAPPHCFPCLSFILLLAKKRGKSRTKVHCVLVLSPGGGAGRWPAIWPAISPPHRLMQFRHRFGNALRHYALDHLAAEIGQLLLTAVVQE